MKRLCAVLVVLLAAATPASAAVITYETSLSGPAEEPPNNSPGTGNVTVIVDDIANTLFVQATFGGLTGTTTASHIHVINGPGDADTSDTAGPVATQTPSFLAFPLGVTSGSFSQTLDLTDPATYRAGFITAAGDVTAARAALLAALEDERAYFNIHTSTFGGGEIRGFLEQQQEPVPEPATLLLLGAAVGALGLRRARVR